MRLVSLSNQKETVLALVFSLASIFVFLGRGIYLLTTRVLPRTIEVEAMRSAVLEIVTMVTCALLMLPMLVLNLHALRGREKRKLTVPSLRLGHIIASGLLWVVTLCLGSLVLFIPEYGWAGTVPLLPFGIILPLMLLVWAGAGGLLSTSRRRFWSILGFGIAGGTGLAMVSEYCLLSIGRGLGELLWGKHPVWRELMGNLSQQLEAASTPEEMLNLLGPYLSNPWVFFALMLLAMVLVPLIEEAAKVSLLFYIGPRLTSIGEGFALGALCGAGFSLLEGMLAASAMSPMWGIGMVGRAASSVLHVTVSALLGGAIARAFLYQRHRHWVNMYLLSSGLHGLWNGAIVVSLYSALRIMTLALEGDDNAINTLQVVGYGLLILLALGFLFTLFVVGIITLPLCNANLRKQTQQEQANPAVREPATFSATSSQKGLSNGNYSKIL